MNKALPVLAALVPGPIFLYAVDGQVLINQSTLGSGGTLTITSPGSYKLSGNLSAKDQNTDVIVIASNDVTIDLNGFAIIGTADCSTNPCTNMGSGSGIQTAPGKTYSEITVRNGAIRGMGYLGVSLEGYSILVEDLHVKYCGAGGIFAFRDDDIQLSNAIIQNDMVQQTGGIGIASSGSRIVNNVVVGNFDSGIVVRGPAFDLPTGTVTGNVITHNAGFGLELAGSVNYIQNTLSSNQSGNVTGGYNLGQNLCGGAVCP